MTRPIRACFDPAAIRHNHALARRQAGAARIWSVVKANAYGHGLLRVAEALADIADGFALIELDGAIALREAGFRQPILMLEGFYDADELPSFAEYSLTPALHSQVQVDALLATVLPARLPVYLKLNTGMNRLGFDEAEFRGAFAALESSHRVADITLMTHFADADGERGVEEQWSRFCKLRGDSGLPACLANSAALLRYPETAGDWARPGIMLYGSSPYPEMDGAENIGLLPAMTLASEIISVRDLKVGDRVGYGGIFTATAPMRIGIVACGYGDGYPRHAPSGTSILVGGRRTCTVGRVSMDKLCVDITELPEAGVGAPVVLWGQGLSVDEVATAAGTISYELFCALSARVPVIESG
jgi:alanine racemase